LTLQKLADGWVKFSQCVIKFDLGPNTWYNVYNALDCNYFYFNCLQMMQFILNLYYIIYAYHTVSYDLQGVLTCTVPVITITTIT